MVKRLMAITLVLLVTGCKEPTAEHQARSSYSYCAARACEYPPGSSSRYGECQINTEKLKLCQSIYLAQIQALKEIK